MITVTLIRHGESHDNTKNIWSGWKDSPLTELGHKQARALASALRASSTRFTHLYTSDLARAHSTALAILDSHPDPKPPIKTTPKLREQHFGIAEGRAWDPYAPRSRSLEELYRAGIFPPLETRDAKFPDGECLEDVAHRVQEVIKECVLPHVLDPESDGAYIGMASHGICIAELIPALLRLDPKLSVKESYRGHLNTAWSRLEISLKEPRGGPYSVDSPPPLTVRLLTFNNCDHLTSMSSVASESENKAARAYFAGAGLPAVSTTNAEVVAEVPQ